MNLIWFREDLRIEDNSALYHAAKTSDDGLLAIYFITTNIWQQHDMAACRVEFILRGLQQLSSDLAKLNIPLLIKTAKNNQAIKKELLSIAEQHTITTLFFNKQYEIDELNRDEDIRNDLQKKNVDVISINDQCIIAPGKILTNNGGMFKVFTPFKKQWLTIFHQQNSSIYPKPKPQQKLAIKPDKIPTELKGFSSGIDATLWPAGQAAALQRLAYFCKNKIDQYHQQRDIPSVDGTSKLSPYLSTGMLSARQCLQAALAVNDGELASGNQGVMTWINELIWREFYKHILVAYPRISKHKPFQPATEQIKWHNNQQHFTAWKNGQTGIPIIDAAMRQLNQTGWMHNRLRMIVAMFLSKNLLLDWRLGEKYFMQNLIDGDLAANNGGWQWSASTGTDAAPYFRVFNPIRQSERFDPEGSFIKQYCPELCNLDAKTIHDPNKNNDLLKKAQDYPQAIVDLSLTRKKAIAVFKALK